MTNNTSVTSFNQLATKTILDIFEYLFCNDIISVFFDFNQRFNSIIFEYQYLLNNFETTIRNLYFWENVLSIIESQIQCLTITTIDFDFSLKFFPNLKFLITSSPFPFNYERLYSIFESEQFNLSKINLEKFDFTSETAGSDYCTFEQYFLSLINLIKQFSSTLIYLSIDLSRENIVKDSRFQLNGIKLQQQLLESMTQLKTFHFYTRLYEDLFNLKYLLPTFENQFWFDHNWSIGIHGKYLYTLPFHFDKLYDFIDFDHINLNNLGILNFPCTWYRVKSIDLSKSSELN
jgi:hypothetical protein